MSVTCGVCYDKDTHFEFECRDPEGCSCCGKAAREARLANQAERRDA